MGGATKYYDIASKTALLSRKAQNLKETAEGAGVVVVVEVTAMCIRGEEAVVVNVVELGMEGASEAEEGTGMGRLTGQGVGEITTEDL